MPCFITSQKLHSLYFSTFLQQIFKDARNFCFGKRKISRGQRIEKTFFISFSRSIRSSPNLWMLSPFFAFFARLMDQKVEGERENCNDLWTNHVLYPTFVIPSKRTKILFFVSRDSIPPHTSMISSSFLGRRNINNFFPLPSIPPSSH